MAKLLA